jgi:hypothetical protein
MCIHCCGELFTVFLLINGHLFSLLTPLFCISALMSTPINNNHTVVTWILVPTFQRNSVSMFRAKDADSILL